MQYLWSGFYNPKHVEHDLNPFWIHTVLQFLPHASLARVANLKVFLQPFVCLCFKLFTNALSSFILTKLSKLGHNIHCHKSILYKLKNFLKYLFANEISLIESRKLTAFSQRQRMRHAFYQYLKSNFYSSGIFKYNFLRFSCKKPFSKFWEIIRPFEDSSNFFIFF